MNDEIHKAVAALPHAIKVLDAHGFDVISVTAYPSTGAVVHIGANINDARRLGDIWTIDARMHEYHMTRQLGDVTVMWLHALPGAPLFRAGDKVDIATFTLAGE